MTSTSGIPLRSDWTPEERALFVRGYMLAYEHMIQRMISLGDEASGGEGRDNTYHIIARTLDATKPKGIVKEEFTLI